MYRQFRGFILVLGALGLFLFSPGREASAESNSSEAFMSVTFGLSAKRTQLRMERSGAQASDFLRDGRLSMEGYFEGRPSLFVFGFHPKKGLNHKALYIASTGDPERDAELYRLLMRGYNLRFGKTQEKALPNILKEGRLMYRNIWAPDRHTVIALSYNPEAVNRFPGSSPGDRPIHLVYNYSKWDKKKK